MVNYFVALAETKPLSSSMIKAGACSLRPLILSTDRTTACHESVDYIFYKSNNLDLDHLDLQIRYELSKPSIILLPSDCKVTLKRALCSYVYPRCPDGWVENNSSTWVNTGGHPTFLPYQRPCLSLCTALQQSCYGSLLSSFSDIGPITRTLANCSSMSNYSIWNTGSLAVTSLSAIGTTSLLSTYDLRDYTGQCNYPSVPLVIAENSEKYLRAYDGKGACYGITSTVYVDNSVDASLNSITSLVASQPLLAAPFVAQNATETALQALFQTMPAWLSSTCYASMRKYLCSSYMLAADPHNMTVYRDIKTGFTFLVDEADLLSARQKYTAAALIASYVTYVQSYPHRDVCLDYSSNCGTFLEIWRPNSTLLQPRCDATVTNTLSGATVELFPKQRQAVVFLTQQSPFNNSSGASASVSVNISSNPNRLADSLATVVLESMWSTQCPRVFVVPEDPSNQLNKWIEGTGCAEPCRGSTIPAAFIDRIAFFLAVLGLVLLSVQMFYWAASDLKAIQANYLVIVNEFLLLVMAFAILMTKFTKSTEHMYCLNNAVPRRQLDGDSANLCTAQALILLYTILALAISWFLNIYRLFFKFVLEQKASSQRTLLWLDSGLIFIVPLVPLIGDGVILQVAGFSGAFYPFCTATSAAGNVSYFVFYLPILLLGICGTVMLLWVLCKSFWIFRRAYIASTHAIFPVGRTKPLAVDDSVRSVRSAISRRIFLSRRVSPLELEQPPPDEPTSQPQIQHQLQLQLELNMRISPHQSSGYHDIMNYQQQLNRSSHRRSSRDQLQQPAPSSQPIPTGEPILVPPPPPPPPPTTTTTTITTASGGGGMIITPLMQIVLISLDKIIYDVILMVAIFFTILLLAQRNVFFTAVYQTDYEIWATCIFHTYDSLAVVSSDSGADSSSSSSTAGAAAAGDGNHWESICGSLPTIDKKNLLSLKVAAAFSCLPPLAMAAAHFIARFCRHYFTPSKTISHRNRWAIPESIRLFGMRTTLPAPMIAAWVAASVSAVAVTGVGAGAAAAGAAQNQNQSNRNRRVVEVVAADTVDGEVVAEVVAGDVIDGLTRERERGRIVENTAEENQQLK